MGRRFLGLKPWQFLAFFLLWLASAGTAFGVYRWVAVPETTTAEQSQLVPVLRGDLTTTVETSGSIIFPEKEVLTFGTGGMVGEVLVEPGDTVEKGQVLARLDSTIIASLEKAVVQAQVNLRNAQEALKEAKSPSYWEGERARKEQAVLNARKALEAAKEALDRAKNPPTGRGTGP
jgi:multidrug efflux pump subunit AcrA (membrane-fusion protein)